VLDDDVHNGGIVLVPDGLEDVSQEVGEEEGLLGGPVVRHSHHRPRRWRELLVRVW